LGSIRKAGGGRKRITTRDINLLEDLEDLEYLTKSGTRGDLKSPLRWITQSTHKLAVALQEMERWVNPCNKKGIEFIT
jgi:hypothetical protein